MTSVKVHKVSICVWVTARLQKYGPLEQLAPDYLLLPKHWPDISPALSQDQTEANRQCLFHAKLDTKLKYIVFMLQWFSGNFSFSWPGLQSARNKITFVNLTSHDISNKQTKSSTISIYFPSRKQNFTSASFFLQLRLMQNRSYRCILHFSKSKYNKK